MDKLSVKQYLRFLKLFPITSFQAQRCLHFKKETTSFTLLLLGKVNILQINVRVFLLIAFFINNEKLFGFERTQFSSAYCTLRYSHLGLSV